MAIPLLAPLASKPSWLERERRIRYLNESARTLKSAASVLEREWGSQDEALCARLRESSQVLFEELAELKEERRVELRDCPECQSYWRRRFDFATGWPSHEGSETCRMRASLASGGHRAHCTCAGCW